MQTGTPGASSSSGLTHKESLPAGITYPANCRGKLTEVENKGLNLPFLSCQIAMNTKRMLKRMLKNISKFYCLISICYRLFVLHRFRQ